MTDIPVTNTPTVDTVDSLRREAAHWQRVACTLAKWERECSLPITADNYIAADQYRKARVFAARADVMEVDRDWHRHLAAGTMSAEESARVSDRLDAARAHLREVEATFPVAYHKKPTRPIPALVLDAIGRAQMNRTSAAAHAVAGDIVTAARCMGRAEAYELVAEFAGTRAVPASGDAAFDRSLEKLLPYVADLGFEGDDGSWKTVSLDRLFTGLRIAVGMLQTLALGEKSEEHEARTARHAAGVVACAMFVASRVGKWHAEPEKSLP